MTPTWDISPAGDADVDGIVDIVSDRIGEEDGLEARLVLEDPGFDRRDWLVARTDDGRLAATAAIFSGAMRYRSEEFPAGNIEFVATQRELQGRGAVRALMRALHRRAGERGDLVIVIVGIPFFYRLFGYEYAVPDQSIFIVEPGTNVGSPSDLTIEEVDHDRVPEYQEVQRMLARAADVALEHSDQVAHWLVASPNYRVALVMGRSGATGAFRLYNHEGRPLLYDVAAADPDTLAAIIVAARRDYPNGEVSIVGRRATPLDAVLGKVARTVETFDGYYVRVTDVAALLERLRPVLEKRLAASPLAGWTGTVLLSTYAQSLSVAIDDGKFGAWAKGPGIQAPVTAGGSGVPPDRLATLLFGPHGAQELERRHPDVLLGRQREVMSVLFPGVSADLLTWVKP